MLILCVLGISPQSQKLRFNLIHKTAFQFISLLADSLQTKDAKTLANRYYLPILPQENIMQIHVYDTYVTAKDGHTMHFDVFTAEKDDQKAISYAKEWLASIGEGHLLHRASIR